MRTRHLWFGLVPFLLFPASVVSAQVGMEFGVDAAFERASVSGGDPGGLTYSLFAIPMQSVRIGFLIQDGLSIEPRLGFTRVSAKGGSSDTQVRASLAGLYFLGGEDARFFLSLVSGLDYATISAGGDDASAVQMRVGGGAGVRLPLRDRLSLRTSLEFHRSFESRDALAVDHLILAVGFSFLMR